MSTSASSRLPADFRAQAEALAAWPESAGDRYPARRSADAHERGPAAWTYNRLRLLSHGPLPSEYEQYLDVIAPWWRAQGGPDMFRAQADERGGWLRSVGAPPDSGSADADERQPATWRYRQTRALNAGTLLPEHEAYFDQVAPGWRTSRSVGFQDRADELGRWIRSVDRWPAQRSADPHERSLCSRRRSRVRLLHTGTMSSEHEACLEQVPPGWRPRRGARVRSAAVSPAPADDLPGFVAPARPTEADRPDRERGSTNTREGTER